MHTDTTNSSDRYRPSADVPVPYDVVDVLLWRLAVDVMIEHQTGSDGHCSNLRCADEQGPCTAAVHAQRALRVARRPTAPAPATSRPPVPNRTAATRPVPARQRRGTVVGRATVRSGNAGRFTGWFTSAACAINRWRPDHHLPRRTPGAALSAA
ncbi:hypothetical protein AB0K00_21640 [Dactylosporangium sp. NPDC049525]|uniref:hypothetical protein n=1 Tax=Dactylosporangium sp. NPDC049525 TaxID=3154730 RepID=UPI00342EB15F